MSKQGGQSVFKGVNTQALAALSMFLQYVKYNDFYYVYLEDPKFQDFNIVFSNGRKIICEVKDRKSKFTYRDLKNVVEKLSNNNVVSDDDAVLFICQGVNKNLKDSVKNIKYSKKLLAPVFKKHGYSESLIDLLKQVDFWIIGEDSRDDLELSILSLFSEILEFYLPEKELLKEIKVILIDEIYRKSEKGDKFTKSDLNKRIKDIKKDLQENVEFKKNVKQNISKLFQKIDNDELPTPAELKAISTDRSLMVAILEQILEKMKKTDSKRSINLLRHNYLWDMQKVRVFSYTIFDIFKKNIHTKKNREYILNFFNKNIEKIYRFYFPDYFDVNVIDLIKEIIDKDCDEKILLSGFELFKKIIKKDERDLFYLETKRSDEWKRGKIAELLEKIYDNADNNLKKKIYEFILDNYNLVEDTAGRKYNRYAPTIIFDILKQWIIRNNFKYFENDFSYLVGKLIGQFDELYKNKLGYKKGFVGWELIGPATAFWGHNYHTTDRAFISNLLKPAIEQYYKEHPRKGWKFIKEKCVALTKKEVKKNKPDFLNRAALGIILNRYKTGKGKTANEAFKILKKFVVMGRGFPVKYEVIYEYIRNNSDNISTGKIWKIVDVFLDKYKSTETFIEQIVADLIERGDKRARKEPLKWYEKNDYFKYDMPSKDYLRPIRKYLKTDFDFAIELFMKYIFNKYFIENESFESFKVADMMADILYINNEIGYSIIKKIIGFNQVLYKKSGEKLMSKNLQTVCYAGLQKYSEKLTDKKDGANLEGLFKFLKKYIFKVNDFSSFLEKDFEKTNKEISKSLLKNIPDSRSRVYLVQIASAFAKQKMIKEAIDIVSIFINDPNPYLPGKDPEDKNDEYNGHKKIEEGEEQQSIETVRGWCAWVLMECSVREGQKSIDEILYLTEKLVGDENWYVKHMICFTLSQLARIRLTHLPEKKNKLFLDDNLTEALRKSKQIEKMAFKILEEVADSSENIRKAMGKNIVHAVGHIRTLNEGDANKILSLLKKFPEEIIAEAAPIFIYYAEFRFKAFDKKWRWKADGHYDNLDKFNDKKFKEILNKVILSLSDEHKSRFAHQFRDILKNANIRTKQGKLEFNVVRKYFDKVFIKKYSHYAFEKIFMSISEEFERNRRIDIWYKVFI